LNQLLWISIPKNGFAKCSISILVVPKCDSIPKKAELSEDEVIARYGWLFKMRVANMTCTSEKSSKFEDASSTLRPERRAGAQIYQFFHVLGRVPAW